MTAIFVSINNSTTVPLAANATFIGVTDTLQSWAELDITVAGSPTDAPGMLFFEYSPDGTNWDVSIGLPLAGPSSVPIVLRSIAKFFRVRYVNGDIAQTAFRLTTIFHRMTATRLTRFLSQAVDPNEPIEITRAIINSKQADGTFQNISAEYPLPIADVLTPSAYDHIDLGYAGTDLTSVVYRFGGPSGTIVSTLTLVYSGGNLISVSKS